MTWEMCGARTLSEGLGVRHARVVRELDEAVVVPEAPEPANVPTWFTTQDSFGYSVLV